MKPSPERSNKSALAMIVMPLIAVPIVFALGTAYVAPSTTRTETVDLSRDPSLGSPLPDGVQRLLGLDRASPLEVLIVWGGDCSGCSTASVNYDRLPNEKFDRVYVIYETPDHLLKAQKDRVTNRPSAKVVSDMHGEVKRSLNAVWAGRWYTYKSGLLTALQKDKALTSFQEISREEK